MESEAEMEAAQAYYRRVAEYARDKGVIINVISIKGTTCSMEIVGLLADITSGEVDIVGKNHGDLLLDFYVLVNIHYLPPFNRSSTVDIQLPRHSKHSCDRNTRSSHCFTS